MREVSGLSTHRLHTLSALAETHRERTVRSFFKGSLLLMVALALLLSGCATSAARKKADDKVAFHYRMGMAYLEDRDFQNGLVEFRQAEQIDPNQVKVLFAMGHSLFSQGNYTDAKVIMERLLAIEPDNGEAVNYLGNINEKLGDQDAAIAAFKRAAALPNYRTPHFSLSNLGRIYLLQGEKAQAEEAFLAALKRVPEYYPARADLARLYLDEGRWSDAADQWRMFLDLAPNLTEGHYYLARAYVGLNKPGLARAALQTFIDQAGPLHPLYPGAEALLGDLDGN